MTTATAKKRTLDPTDTATETVQRADGLWIDESSLPTTLAKRGPSKGLQLIALQTEIRASSRILQLADVALGNPKGMPVVERRKKDRKLKK